MTSIGKEQLAGWLLTFLCALNQSHPNCYLSSLTSHLTTSISPSPLTTPHLTSSKPQSLSPNLLPPPLPLRQQLPVRHGPLENTTRAPESLVATLGFPTIVQPVRTNT